MQSLDNVRHNLGSTLVRGPIPRAGVLSETRQRECNVGLLHVSPLDVMVILMMWVGISCDPLTGAAGAGPA